MAIQIAFAPVLVIVAVIVAAYIYMKTKSMAKVGSAFQIIFAIGVFGLTTQLVDAALMTITSLLGLGMLISGIMGLK